MNRERARHGLIALRRNRALSRSADFHSADMLRADFFAHASSDGTPFSTRVSRFRPSTRIGETLAYIPRGQRRGAARRIVQMWLASPGHRAMLLSADFRRVGVARRVGTLGRARVIVYTADFASAR